MFALTEQMPERYRALILVTTFACLRWGEAAALQRQDIDTNAGTVRVRQAFVEHRGTGLVLGPPKSGAGLRTITLPAAVLPALRQHLADVPDVPEAFVFTGPNARPIWRGNFNKLVGWPDAARAVGVPGLHFHDLRHTGNTLAAGTRTSLRDLMARMGHDSPRAALIYQHATSEADQAIAEAVNDAVERERKKARKPRRKPAKKRPDDPDDGAAGMLAEVS